MRSGCLNLVFLLVAASVATALTVVGAILFFSFAALTFESPTGIEAILRMVVAVVAGYFFVRVGRGVWRDLRERRPAVESGKGEQEERGPAERGGR
ncbi:MAG: hypothetical protein LC714_03555 [Actinobacteria bacterium]|nr:hypothetical protein [Actinomycetota bacterium]